MGCLAVSGGQEFRAAWPGVLAQGLLGAAVPRGPLWGWGSASKASGRRPPPLPAWASPGLPPPQQQADRERAEGNHSAFYDLVTCVPSAIFQPLEAGHQAQPHSGREVQPRRLQGGHSRVGRAHLVSTIAARIWSQGRGGQETVRKGPHRTQGVTRQLAIVSAFWPRARGSSRPLPLGLGQPLQLPKPFQGTKSSRASQQLGLS